jgi:acyl-coenzyme A thioesterase PaaI-like protein
MATKDAAGRPDFDIMAKNFFDGTATTPAQLVARGRRCVHHGTKHRRGFVARWLLFKMQAPCPPTLAPAMELPAHQLSMTVLMTPDTANFSGKVHGGSILKLLDQVAYACASRYAGAYVVTLSVDQVVFRQPIHVGEMEQRFTAIR